MGDHRSGNCTPAGTWRGVRRDPEHVPQRLGERRVRVGRQVGRAPACTTGIPPVAVWCSAALEQRGFPHAGFARERPRRATVPEPIDPPAELRQLAVSTRMVAGVHPGRDRRRACRPDGSRDRAHPGGHGHASACGPRVRSDHPRWATTASVATHSPVAAVPMSRGPRRSSPHRSPRRCGGSGGRLVR